jgi:hypothetical protein
MAKPRSVEGEEMVGNRVAKCITLHGISVCELTEMREPLLRKSGGVGICRRR